MKGPGSLGSSAPWDIKPYAQEWVKLSGDGEKSFWNALPGSPCTVVPKPIGEVLMGAAIKLRKYRNASIDRIKVNT